MKIKLSKSQWEEIGKKAGWSTLDKKLGQIKESQNMDKQMDNFFSPSITLKRHMMNGKVIKGYWYVDLNKDFQLARQLIEEAGIKRGFGNEISDSDLDAFETAAGKHGYSVETIGE